ncbi:MAG: RES family NAD+ phosphorylase, partial [Pyrinomonadaceae bacterium]
DAPFPTSQMGAPSSRYASYGRANPAGIPYLYLGSTETTAISEVRPHAGGTVCVAQFKTSNNLKLVDLRNPKKTVSPFELEDATAIGRMRSDLPFLLRLGDELTSPVLPEAAAIDYTPSQYLCEFIKRCGYNGVVYRSSVSAGINLALFDPTLAEAGAVASYRVTGVSVEVEPT